MNNYKKENIKLILLDLDGTLLLKDSRVPSNLLDVIQKLKKKGIMLGIATGRYYGSIKRLFKDTYKEMVLVSVNGSSVYVDDKQVLFLPFEDELYQKVLDISLKLDPNKYLVQPTLNDYVLGLKNDPSNEFMEKFGMPVKVVDRLDEVKQDVLCMCIMNKDGQDIDFFKYFKDLEEELELMPSGFGCMDIMPKGITKASGIKQLCDILGIAKDNVMAIGDAMNDFEMLKLVGLPVAMKNADPKIKEIAKLVTEKTNEENGCLDFIEEYFKLND